ncbi:hypothetical protein TRIP_B250041 [uncultured Desulfatiglans sp.]|uniref:Uncharacterized protein n=1 Tax=Uncultured Desulfatiglans sp. TaxID=1748965 RepID=A0A653A4I7_UNCDX|nr:hypothetical protein TRIP_B250041 [uncultured Desulfatiglans sp.]
MDAAKEQLPTKKHSLIWIPIDLITSLMSESVDFLSVLLKHHRFVKVQGFWTKTSEGKERTLVLTTNPPMKPIREEAIRIGLTASLRNLCGI